MFPENDTSILYWNCTIFWIIVGAMFLLFLLNHSYIWCGLIQKMWRPGQSVLEVQAGYLEQRSQMRSGFYLFPFFTCTCRKCITPKYSVPFFENIKEQTACTGSELKQFRKIICFLFFISVYAHQQFKSHMQSSSASAWRSVHINYKSQ